MSVNACAEIVRRADPDRFLAAMAAPPAARETLFPLYALNAEISKAPWVTDEPLIAEMRLQWWRDALDEIREGRTARRHEVVAPLADVLDPPGCDAMTVAIDARRWDIAREPFAGNDALLSHLDATAGSLMWTAARLLGATDETAVREVATAQGLANWLMAVPALEAAGRPALPDDNPEEIAMLAEEVHDRLVQARPSRAARPATLAAWRAGPILRQAARAPERVLSGTLGTSEFARRAGLIWRILT